MNETTETSTTKAAPPERVPYHWVVTLQTADGRQASLDGTIPVAEGSSRAATYTALVAHVKKHFGMTGVASVVLFFSLERDVLGGER
ncbi:hypothetical protein SXANM310S_00020 [Streptomyces xanthochromogenes]